MSSAEGLRGFVEHVYNRFIDGANQIETTHGLRTPQKRTDKYAMRILTHEELNQELDEVLDRIPKDLPTE